MIKKLAQIEESPLSVQQAAAFFNVSPGTIRRWAYQAQLSGRKVGLRGDWRFTKEELNALAKPNSVTVRAQTAVSSPPKNQHIVQFYDDDAYLLNSVKKFIEDGEIAIVLATPEHRKSLEKNLSVGGLSLAQAKKDGKYRAYDAEETLAQFMVNNSPDPALFFRIVGTIIESAVKSGQKVHAFGEMVAVLWKKRNPEGALRIEELWNDLQVQHNFALFCAYPMHSFEGDAHRSGFVHVCDTHGTVTPSESYARLTNEEERLREIAVLQQKAKSLEAEVRKSRVLEKQKDEFLSIASHELKTPVTSIKAYGQVLQSHFTRKGDATAAALVSKMDTQVNKLTKLIEDLLDVSKIQSGKIRFESKVFDCNEMINEIVDEMRHLTTRQTISIESAGPAMFCGDRYRVGQVLTNLLSNAIKYSPEGGNIFVSTNIIKKDLIVSVQDFGIGISQDHQKHVFERFYRVQDTLSETFPGLGLGLHISHEIIRRQKGTLWVESNHGTGSTFSFSLPLSKQRLE